MTTLEEAITVAQRIIQENPERRNPVAPIGEYGYLGCSYFGPDNTSCLAGEVAKELGLVMDQYMENVPIASITAAQDLFGTEVCGLLQSLQWAADQNIADEELEDFLTQKLIPREWGDITVTDDGKVEVEDDTL